MPIGLTATLTRAQVDFQGGSLAQRLNALMTAIEDWHRFVLSAQDPDLAVLGYTAEEITLLRTCAAEMEQLRTIYTGEAALQAAKDFRVFLQRTWGTGFAPTGGPWIAPGVV